MSSPAEVEARARGAARSGEVFLEDFDKGIWQTLGATMDPAGNIYLTIPGVAPPPPSDVVKSYPGIPVIFSSPEAPSTAKVLPMVEINRGEESEAFTRTHASQLKYRAPAQSAREVVSPLGALGWDAVEEQVASRQVDISYTLIVRARREDTAILMRRFVARVYTQRGVVRVVDSEGDERIYECEREGISSAKDLGADLNQRECSFTFSLKVQGEDDEAAPHVLRVVTSANQVRERIL